MAKFDQCRYGCEATKPTRLLAFSSGHQCDRRGEVQSSKAGMGKKYTASHERVAGRKRKLEGGRTEHASKALAHYPPELCSTLASMAYRVKTTRAKQLRGWKGVLRCPDPSSPMRGLEMIQAARHPKKPTLGGMRNPSTSMSRLPESQILGSLIGELLDTAIKKYPRLCDTARDILEAKKEVTPMDRDLVDSIRKSVLIVAEPGEIEASTAPASSPLNVPTLMGWHRNSDDPDAGTLANWILHGSPLGFDQAIQRQGIFPASTNTGRDYEGCSGLGELAFSNDGRERRPSPFDPRG